MEVESFHRIVPRYQMKFHIRLLFLTSYFLILIFGCDRPPEGMVRIPAGTFVMGTDAVDEEEKAAEFGITQPWFEDEHPAHPVKLPVYYMDQYEVSNASYRKFIQETGKRAPKHWVGGIFPPGLDHHPVTHVTWDDANAYCRWSGKRLPTEAEWEKAARGSDSRIYPWGDEFDESKANVNNEVGHTTAVGQYEEGKSIYGAYDMIGNVWEWTADWYQAFPGSTYQHKKFGEKVRVLRGNSWAGLGHYPPEEERVIKAHYSRGGFRFSMRPDRFLNDTGLRCAKSKE